MKKLLILILLALLLLLCACKTRAPADAATTAAPHVIPQELLGTWTSASSGELNLTETFTFYDDGAVYATALLDAEPEKAVNGTYYTAGNKLYCEVTGGVEEPYALEYTFRIDGRELLLTDSDGTSQFLRVS